MVKFAKISMLVVTLCLAVPLGHALAADDYPSKPIRFVILATPGGLNDIVARVYGNQVSARLGQPVVVESRPGAGGVIGMEAVAKSAPDGYTIVLVYPGVMSVNPHLIKTLPYDPLKDFVPVAQLASYPMILMSHPSLPVKSLQDLIRLAKTRPGALSYASSGNATTSHLTAELLKYRAGIDLLHIPYKGETPAHTDLMAGRVQLGVSTLQAALPLIRSGKANAIAVTSLVRSSLAPDIPTVSESGVAEFQVSGWLGVCAPAGTPKAIVDRLSREFNAVASLADTRDRLAGQGTEPVAMSSDAFGTWIREETDRWGTVITRARITLN